MSSISSLTSIYPRRPSLLAELTQVHVHVISEEPVIRAGIRHLLASRSPSVAFVEDLATEPADVVFYDVLGIWRNGDRHLAAIVKDHPGRVLALGRTLQPGLTLRALELGATAAVPLAADAEEILTTIHHLVDARFPHASATETPPGSDPRPRLATGVCLTAREQQVLTLIVAGASNGGISDELFISVNTVKSLIRSAYAKMGVKRRAQAVAWGINHGYARSLRRPEP
jgi:DNA-binding NarL/FixJ family response regulator